METRYSASVKAVTDGEMVLATANIPASPEAVFRAFSDPAEIERWWGDDQTYYMTHWVQDFRAGGTYTVDVRNADGSVLPASGTFLEINAPGRLVHTRRYDWDFPGLGRRVTNIYYKFEPVDGGTGIIVKHEGFTGFPEAARQHATGWERVLHWLLKDFSR